VTCTCHATARGQVRDPVALVVTKHTDDCRGGGRIERERRPIRPSDIIDTDTATCVGYRRPLHPTTDELIRTNHDRGVALCADCWRRWRSEVDG
jgi:hypothetical protein